MAQDQDARDGGLSAAATEIVGKPETMVTTTPAAGSADRGGLARYIAAETAVGAGMNTLMSLAFAWLVFHGHARVPMSGLVFDAIPQSFMVGLMSILPVSFLTRMRARKGRSLPSPPLRSFTGSNRLAVRALAAAAATGLVGFLVFHALSPAFVPTGLSFGRLLVVKAAWAVILSLIIVPLAAIAALKDAA